MSLEATYLANLATAGNAIAAFAAAQTIAFTLSLVMAGKLPDPILRARPVWLYGPLFIATAVYCCLIAWCGRQESALVVLAGATDPSLQALQRSIALLTFGRIFIVMACMIPLALVMHARRTTSAHPKPSPRK